MRFLDWIMPYLAPETQVRLRDTMREGPPPGDAPGYLYAFECKDRCADILGIKVGYTNSPNRRYAEHLRERQVDVHYPVFEPV